MSQQQNHSQSNLSYREILQEAEGLLVGQWITDLANISSLLMQHLPRINWVGFYLAHQDQKTLWLGPFQGLPACTSIPFGKGVCGTSALQKKTIRVADVDQFPDHIVCDSRSKSEIVVPLLKNELVVGVLDVDSAELNRFTQDDLVFLEELVQKILKRNLNS